MKFKDKNGNVFEDIRGALDAFCSAPDGSHEDCEKCLFRCSELTCVEFSDAFPIAAARLMGYEVVEDGLEKNYGNCGHRYVTPMDNSNCEVGVSNCQRIPEKTCTTCANTNPSVACVNCGSKHWNYRPREEETNTDKQEFELVTFLETEQERFIQNSMSELRSPMQLDWLQRLELSKAMLGRGVSEKMAWQIIRDFQVRMDSLKELIK